MAATAEFLESRLPFFLDWQHFAQAQAPEQGKAPRMQETRRMRDALLEAGPEYWGTYLYIEFSHRSVLLHRACLACQCQ